MTANQIRLRCTTAEFEALEDAEETAFPPVASGIWGRGAGDLPSMPNYGLGFARSDDGWQRPEIPAACDHA